MCCGSIPLESKLITGCGPSLLQHSSDSSSHSFTWNARIQVLVSRRTRPCTRACASVEGAMAGSITSTHTIILGARASPSPPPSDAPAGRRACTLEGSPHAPRITPSSLTHTCITSSSTRMRTGLTKAQPLCVGIHLCARWPPVQDPRRRSRGLTHMQSRALGALCRAGAGPQLPSRSGRTRALQPLDYQTIHAIGEPGRAVYDSTRRSKLWTRTFVNPGCQNNWLASAATRLFL
jgi:hypothetical protein